MASINKMLLEYYFIAGSSQALLDTIQESIEPDAYYDLTKKLRDEYKPKLLAKFKDPFARSIICSPFYFRRLAAISNFGVDVGLLIDTALKRMGAPGAVDTTSAQLFNLLVLAILVCTTDNGLADLNLIIERIKIVLNPIKFK